MNDMRRSIYLSVYGCGLRVHEPDAYYEYARPEEAVEFFVKRIIIMGYVPEFGGPLSRTHFNAWFDKQPNKAELAELLNLQEMV